MRGTTSPSWLPSSMQGQWLGTYRGIIFWAWARNRPIQTIPLLSPQRLYLCPFHSTVGDPQK
ncbi:unnamed protein product [Staurois parvus]|uniref:Uncharacterized protein n=1 Tax=Staurois parvus TaxID=386267 RepID=A0ABN9AM64_9NEOB|nr:unnamed protein product [Staurois parvus]